jgi:hypothetical protein
LIEFLDFPVPAISRKNENALAMIVVDMVVRFAETNECSSAKPIRKFEHRRRHANDAASTMHPEIIVAFDTHDLSIGNAGRAV